LIQETYIVVGTNNCNSIGCETKSKTNRMVYPAAQCQPRRVTKYKNDFEPGSDIGMKLHWQPARRGGSLPMVISSCTLVF